MSKENLVDSCNKVINFINEDKHSKSYKNSLLDISDSSENSNSIDKLNLSNIDGKNSFKKSTMLTSTDGTSDIKLNETNTVHDSTQLNQAECKLLIDKINANETYLNSQDENQLFELLKKNKDYVLTTNNIEISDLNTQQFMDLNLCGAIQQLNAFSPTLDLDSSKTQTIKQIDSDNSTAILPLPLINDLRNVEIKNKSANIINDPKISKKLNSESSKIDLQLPTRDQYVELSCEDQDAEIIAFRAMCEAFLKIGIPNKNKINHNKIVKKNNQVNHKVINCVNSIENEPSTSSKSNSNFYKGTYDISKRLGLKRHQFDDLRFDVSDDSSPEYSNELSSKQNNLKNKKTKITFLKNNLKIDSNFDSSKDTTMIQPKNVKRRKLSDLTLFEDNEDNCMIIENPLTKVQNVNDWKCNRKNDDLLEQNKLLKENQTIFYFSSTGKVHNDMLKYIQETNCNFI